MTVAEYLVSIALGPVQDFIAASRRTRDLWFGSRLLSELSKRAAAELLKHGELIFPYSSSLAADLSPNSRFAAANKILAVVGAESERELRGLLSKVRQAAQNYLEDRSRQARMTALHQAIQAGKLDSERAEAQLENFLEFYSAWVPYRADRYRECRDEVEQLMAARKALRDFPAYQGRAGVPKSSLDGVRESVIQEKPLKDGTHFVRVGEQLDGIGILKRFGRFEGRGPSFESTHDVAARPYVERLKRTCVGQYEKYRATMAEHREVAPFSHSHLYRDSAELNETELARAIKAIRVGLPAPQPAYYAFFVGDGDCMGSAISGKTTIGQHRHFSQRLSGFSKELEEMFENEDSGELVFAGGDDVVALLPLHTALERAKQIREAFAKAMGSDEDAPTFSAGLAVVHAMDPLTETRRVAEEAEKLAKRRKPDPLNQRDKGKDALAITIVPRSGAPLNVVDRWDRMFPPDPQKPGLSEAVRLYVDGEISQGYPHELRELLDSTGRRKLEIDSVLLDLARALAEKKESSRAYERFLEPLRQDPNPRAAVQRVCDLLLAARPFARAKREANHE